MANGFSFTYNGTDLGEAAYNLYVDRSSAPYFGKPRVDERPLAGETGSVTQGSTFESITLTLQCKVVAVSRAALITQLEAIKGVLEVTLQGEKVLVLDEYPGRQYTGRFTSAFNPDLAINGAEFTLTFLVPSGTWV